MQFPLVDRFLALPQEGRIAAEYVWIGGSGHDMRSKTKILDKAPTKPDDLPIWNFDGSSTGQAPGMIKKRQHAFLTCLNISI